MTLRLGVVGGESRVKSGSRGLGSSEVPEVSGFRMSRGPGGLQVGIMRQTNPEPALHLQVPLFCSLLVCCVLAALHL